MTFDEALTEARKSGQRPARVTRTAWKGTGYVYIVNPQRGHFFLRYVSISCVVDDRFEQRGDIFMGDWEPVCPVQQPFNHPEPPRPWLTH